LSQPTKMPRKKGKKGKKGKTMSLDEFNKGGSNPPPTPTTATQSAWNTRPNIQPEPAPAPEPTSDTGMTIPDILTNLFSTSIITKPDMVAFHVDSGLPEEWVVNLMRKNPCVTRCSKQDVAKMFLNQLGGTLTNCIHSGKMTGKGALELAIFGPHSG
jgi:hypothetical protein